MNRMLLQKRLQEDIGGESLSKPVKISDGIAVCEFNTTGAIYQLMSQGDRREEIFRDDLDREDFLKTLGAACQKLGGRSTPNRRWRSSSQRGSSKARWRYGF
jgi:hypothetical protein